MVRGRVIFVYIKEIDECSSNSIERIITYFKGSGFLANWFISYTSLKQWLHTNGDVVQIGTSLMTLFVTLSTLLVTIVYVRATQKLVHLPYKSLIIPRYEKARDRLDTMKIVFFNSGPGVAMNIKISTRIIVSSNYETKVHNLNKNISTYANGAYEMKALAEETFTIRGFSVFDYPIVVEWESISGKKYNSSWIGVKGPYHQTIFKRLNIVERFTHRLKIAWEVIKFPYLKNLHYKKNDYELLEQSFLKRLDSEGSLTYDRLADPIRKTDEEVEKILRKMHKFGLVGFDGHEASITDTGRAHIIKND